MAQVKIFKPDSGTSLPREHDSVNDDITMKSFSVTGSGPSLSATGLAMATQDISGIDDLSFAAPGVSTIVGSNANNTIIINDLMGQQKKNVLTAAAAVQFATITDAAGEVDTFKLPTLAGPPTATPTDSGSAFVVYDQTNKNLYVWDGALWDNLENSEAVESSFTAGEDLAAGDAVYLSAANTVSKADADDDTKTRVIGFASAAVLATAAVLVKSSGIVPGLTGLTAGARYYLSATAGGITSTAPTSSGHNVMQVGFAKSTTELQIQFQYMNKRA